MVLGFQVASCEHGKVEVKKFFGPGAKGLVAHMNTEGQHRGAVNAAKAAAAKAAEKDSAHDHTHKHEHGEHKHEHGEHKHHHGEHKHEHDDGEHEHDHGDHCAEDCGHDHNHDHKVPRFVFISLHPQAYSFYRTVPVPSVQAGRKRPEGAPVHYFRRVFCYILSFSLVKILYACLRRVMAKSICDL
jgi:hypothetical protein